MLWTDSIIEAIENDEEFWKEYMMDTNNKSGFGDDVITNPFISESPSHAATVLIINELHGDEPTRIEDRYGYTLIYPDGHVESETWEEAEADNYFLEDR